MKVTLKDIAKRTNLSVSTVSHIINKRDVLTRIKPETRDRVLKVVEELDYLPYAAARSLASNKSYTYNIGFVFANPFKGGLSNPFYSKILEGIESCVRKRNYNLLITSYENITGEKHQLPRKIRESNIDGIIIAGHPDEYLVKAIQKKEIPVVIVGDSLRNIKINSVTSDNYLGMQTAVDHLHKMGHSRIAFIKLKRDHFSPDVENKFLAYKKALEHNALKYTPELVVEGDGEIESGYNAMMHLLDLNPQPTAVIASNDIMALAAIKAANARGLNIPDDISIMGYDNITLSELSNPALTTIDSFPAKMGEESAARLLEVILTSDITPKTLLISPELVVRESCGKVTK